MRIIQSFFSIFHYIHRNNSSKSVINLWKQLGKAPKGARKARIEQSPNYSNGRFVNLEHTPQFTEGYSIFKVFGQMLFGKKENTKPSQALPTVPIDLHHLPVDQNLLVWFGHSSYYFQLNGLRFLVDPVFSKYASPIPGTNPAFVNSPIFSASDFPEIDYLLITHDHYDHLDFSTVKAFQYKIKKVICGLGVASHLEYWGFNSSKIIEKDWNESEKIESNIIVHILPTRHFSGRFLSPNNTLWASYLLETPNFKLYVGGDSGYGEHFKTIGEKFGPIDFAVLENGQYNPAWKYIHFLPEETVEAAKDLQVKRVIPIHHSKFALSNHDWRDPMNRIHEASKNTTIPFLFPKIGEVVYLNENQELLPWWK